MTLPPRPGMEFLDLPQGRLRVRRAGAGERALIFCTDPPNVLEHYGPLFARLKRERALTTIAFEPAGFGHSTSKGPAPHSIEAGAAATEALLEKLGIRGAVLAFPCVAAYAALRVAARRPDLVAGLVLLQAPAWREGARWVARVDRRRVLRTPVVGQVVNYVRADAIIRRWYAAAAGAPERGARLQGFAIEALDHGARFPLASAFQTLFRGPAPDLAPVAQPTLALWGAADRTHARTEKDSILEHAPGATVVEVEGVGHFPELEDPNAFAGLVLDWMRAQKLIAA